MNELSTSCSPFCLKHYCTCSGPCSNASELSLTGLPPIMPQPTALKDKGGGFHDTRYGHLLQHNIDEVQPHTASKCECISPPHDVFSPQLGDKLSNKNILQKF